MINENELNEAADQAANQTDQQLAGRAASIGMLTAKELGTLFPTKGDQENFAKLMDIVNSNTSENDKIGALVKNASNIASSVLRLLKHFA